MADITDLITHVKLGTLTQLASPGYNIGDSSINGVDLSAWDPDDAVFFGIDVIDPSTSKRVDGTYCEFKGILSGDSIGSLELINGNPQNYAAGTNTRVYQLITAAWANSIVDALLKTLNKDGTPKVNPNPTGLVAPFAGATAPDQWLICDGSEVSRSVYSDLYAVVGSTYGDGDGSTTFNLPDLNGRMVVGEDTGQTEFDALGVNGGQKGLMEHHHGIQTPFMPSGTGSLILNDRSADAPMWTDNATPGSNGEFWAGAGGGPAKQTLDTGTGANNMNPYLVLNYIIKI